MVPAETVASLHNPPTAIITLYVHNLPGPRWLLLLQPCEVKTREKAVSWSHTLFLLSLSVPVSASRACLSLTAEFA